MSALETELAELLHDLSNTQDELLAVLTEKQQYMAVNDLDAMESVQKREEELGERLQACHDRRQELLNRAAEQGLPDDSLGNLSKAVTSENGDNLEHQVKETAGKMRILQHHGLTNWVVAQRTLLHLSQMLEILARGGRLNATYGNDEFTNPGGTLIDQEA